jgi:1,4-dihydroxy-2-naphthoyl-CoA hydrolase
MYIAENQVRMHDTDMAGILYFPRQFRFAHDALEDFLQTLGISFDHLFKKEKFVFVIVHAEGDYYKPLHVGDKLEIQLTIDNIGTTSFSIAYKIFKKERDLTLVGSVKTVHVILDAKTRQKIPIPKTFRDLLEQTY